MTRTERSQAIAITCTAAAASILTIVLGYTQWQKRKQRTNRECIYLDYNGTTPIYPEVYSAMIPFLTTHFGNPSSSHAFGKVPKEAIQEARLSIAKLLLRSSNGETNAEEIANGLIFTGCGTEADNLAIYLAIRSYHGNGTAKPHVITTCVEHPAVLECLRYYEERNEIEVTYLSVDSECLISPSQVESSIRPTTCLVTIMYANNEVGSVMPICEIGAICSRYDGILFHTDAAQALGKVPVSIQNVDMMTIVGHKMGAPKGIAALFVRNNCLSKEESRQEPFLYGKSGGLLLGGGQEAGHRAGTENVPYIVAMGKAADLLMQSSQNHLYNNMVHFLSMKDKLFQCLVEHLGRSNLRINGPKAPSQCLPNTLSIGIQHMNSGKLLSTIGDKVAASAGSACHSSSDSSISPVLRAMNVPMEYAIGTLRLSVGLNTTLEEVQLAADVIAIEVKKQWKEKGIKS